MVGCALWLGAELRLWGNASGQGMYITFFDPGCDSRPSTWEEQRRCSMSPTRTVAYHSRAARVLLYFTFLQPLGRTVVFPDLQASTDTARPEWCHKRSMRDHHEPNMYTTAHTHAASRCCRRLLRVGSGAASDLLAVLLHLMAPATAAVYATLALLGRAAIGGPGPPPDKPKGTAAPECLERGQAEAESACGETPKGGSTWRTALSVLVLLMSVGALGLIIPVNDHKNSIQQFITTNETMTKIRTVKDIERTVNESLMSGPRRRLASPCATHHGILFGWGSDPSCNQTSVGDSLHVLSLMALTVGGLCLLCSMYPAWNGGTGRNGGGGSGGAGRSGRREPPSWDPSREATYPFRHWISDLLAWSILSTEMDSSQQCAAIRLQLGGSARELAMNMTWEEMSQGGIINGAPVDPVTLLLSHLATQFAPLGEESRLSATTELFHFHRNRGETIDELLSRFMTLRFRAGQNGGAAMSWEGYSWLLLRACGVNASQLMTILQPFQNRYPNTEPEFNAMSVALRRIGHILEHAPNNIATQLRTPQASGWFVGAPSSEPSGFLGLAGNASPQDGGAHQPADDPWQTEGLDPWAASGAASSQAPIAPSGGAAGSSAFPAHQASPEGYFSGTDTDTASDTSRPVVDYSSAEFHGMTPQQVDEHLFWIYTEAKSRWRKHMNKPTRKARRFVRKNSSHRSLRGKGLGKGKGKGGASRFTFLSEMSEVDYDAIFYGGKGKSKGKSRTSGKGKGRRKNPRGYDGQIMTCSICGSEDHFRAQCPQNTGGGTSGGGCGGSHSSSFGGYVDAGPLAGVQGVAFLASATEVAAVVQTGPAPSTPSLSGSWAVAEEPLLGSWSSMTTVQTVELGASFTRSIFGNPMPTPDYPPWLTPAGQRAPATAWTAPVPGLGQRPTLNRMLGDANPMGQPTPAGAPRALGPGGTVPGLTGMMQSSDVPMSTPFIQELPEDTPPTNHAGQAAGSPSASGTPAAPSTGHLITSWPSPPQAGLAQSPQTYDISTPPQSAGVSTLPVVPPSPGLATPSWEQRVQQVNQTMTDHEPRPDAAALAIPENAAATVPLLSEFRHLANLRETQQQRRGQNRHQRPNSQPWAHLAMTPQGVLTNAPVREIGPDSATTIVSMNQLMLSTNERLEIKRAQREQRIQATIAQMRGGAPGSAPPRSAAQPEPSNLIQSVAERCSICLEAMLLTETIVRLECTHRFHQECMDSWCAHLYGGASAADRNITCPVCRSEVRATEIEAVHDGAAPDLESGSATPRQSAPSQRPSAPSMRSHHSESATSQHRSAPSHRSHYSESVASQHSSAPQYSEQGPGQSPTTHESSGPGTPRQSHYGGASTSVLDTPPHTPSGQGTPFLSPFGSPIVLQQDTSDEDQSTLSSSWTAPWWPAPGTEAVPGAPFFHAATKLADGRLSMIIDPGAYTNLMGETLAKELAERAVSAGHTPTQMPLPKPLSIQGVGNGYQKCSHQILAPIAVPNGDGKATLHSLHAPIVEGTGKDIPGLLGLQSLESMNAILDTGNHELILPGPGEVEYRWPAGTVSIPLRKAPSGHLVMVIDDFENATRSKVLPERTVELLVSEPASSPALGEPTDTADTSAGPTSGSPAPPSVEGRIFRM